MDTWPVRHGCQRVFGRAVQSYFSTVLLILSVLTVLTETLPDALQNYTAYSIFSVVAGLYILFIIYLVVTPERIKRWTARYHGREID